MSNPLLVSISASNVIYVSRLKQSVIDKWQAQLTLRTYCIGFSDPSLWYETSKRANRILATVVSGWGWQCPTLHRTMFVLLVVSYFVIMCSFWNAGYGISKRRVVGDLSFFVLPYPISVCFRSMWNLCFSFNMVFSLSQISSKQREQTISWHL